MMNKFIKLKMIPSRGNGGAFYARASYKLDNIEAPFSNIMVKIDTGCSVSTIPLGKQSEEIRKTNKKNDIINQVSCLKSYGVESGGEEHPESITLEEKMKDKAYKFKHKISDFVIDGVQINADSIYLNYDRKGNILIGMDILKNWDIHIGQSKITEECMFIACPYDMLNDEYFRTLNEHFGIDKLFGITRDASETEISPQTDMYDKIKRLKDKNLI